MKILTLTEQRGNNQPFMKKKVCNHLQMDLQIRAMFVCKAGEHSSINGILIAKLDANITLLIVELEPD